ncbi:AraC family transcriptional regulator [Burkholderia gladioli]|uniref:AraC family transcriptional regulator n=1 Tax=Burkholderia gladioli TaxID=28095 RepID=UPI00164156E2|nr:helix-turn-helix domain-containing protein [Burkholderia gladioli]
MSLAPDAISADGAASAPRDTLGCLSSKLRKNRQWLGEAIAIHHKCMDETQLHRVAMPACERGFLLGISLKPGHRRRIFRGARVEDRRFEQHSIYLRDFSDDYLADLHGQFDFLLVEVSPRYLACLAEEHEAPAIDGLSCAAGQQDPVLSHLGAAFAASLDTPNGPDALFAEQLSLAIGMHLARQYGSLRKRGEPAKGRLSARQETLAKELLLLRAHAGSSIADIARECNLSRSYFIRAFARTTGRTPHQWLLEQRTAQARGMIEGTRMTLAEIALACGFADQSHLSRVFAKTLGMTPGAWRRGADN